MKMVTEKLLQAKEAYYLSTPIMSDFEFDALEEELRAADPNNKYFSIVGTNIKGSHQIRHTTPLLSCAKGKSSTDATDWLKRINYQDLLVGMPKLDGLTGCVTYKDGNFSHMTTRGDGKVGQDISQLKDYIGLPDQIPHSGTVNIVGEIYIPKNTTMPTNGKPLRNIASGLVNRKEADEDCKYLHFCVFNVCGIETKTFDGKFLSLNNFEIVHRFVLLPKDVEEFFTEYEDTLRDEWRYETDGIVLQVNDLSQLDRIDSLYEVNRFHHYNFALKPKSESAITTLTGITWDISKYGNVIPVAQFEPVHLGDKEIKNATLNNYDNVERLDLHVGDSIEIANANEIIPFFVAKHNDGDGVSLLIENCPSCNSLLFRNGVHIQCLNESCPEKNIKVITDYCTKCEMDGLSYSTIKTLYNEGRVARVSDLYSLEADHLLNLEGIGEKKISNLLNRVERSKRQTVAQFIARLGIESVGERAVAALGIDSIEKFWALKSSSYVTGNNLIKFREANKEDIKKLLTFIAIEKAVEKTGHKVCMTGKGHKGRKELIVDIEEKGFTFSGTINKELMYLICEDVDGTSSKLTNAKKLGIKLISYEEFFR